MIKAGEIEELTEKFHKTGDITGKEADKIYALFSKNCQATKMNPASSKVDVALLEAFRTWFAEIEKAVDEGRAGIFLSTVNVDYNYSFTEKLNPLDKIRRFGIYGSLWENLPKELNGQTVFPDIKRIGWLRRYGLYDLVADMEVSPLAGRAVDPEIEIRRLSNEIIDKPDDLIGILFSLSVNQLDIPCVSLSVFPRPSSERFLLPKEINEKLEAVKSMWEPILEILISSGVLKAYELNRNKNLLYYINNTDIPAWRAGVKKFTDIFNFINRDCIFKKEKKELLEEGWWMEIDR